MWPHYTFSFFLFIIAFISIGFNRKECSELSLLLCLLASFFAGLRYFSGVDYAEYIALFTNTPNIFAVTADVIKDLPMEPGFIITNSLFKTIGFSSYTFLFFLSFLSICGKGYFFSKLSKNPVLSLFLYFSFIFLNSEFIQIRWAISILFFILGVLFWLKGKNYKSLLFFLFSPTLHSTSVILLLIFAFTVFFARYLKHRQNIFILVLLSFLLSFIFDISSILLSFVGGAEGVEPRYFSYYIIKLRGYLVNSGEAISAHVLFRYIATFLVIFTLDYMVSIKKNVSIDSPSDFLLKLYSVNLAVILIVRSFPILSNRLYVVCELFTAILIINYSYLLIKAKTDYLYFVALSLACFSYWLISINAFYVNGYIFDYTTWLNLYF